MSSKNKSAAEISPLMREPMTVASFAPPSVFT